MPLADPTGSPLDRAKGAPEMSEGTQEAPPRVPKARTERSIKLGPFDRPLPCPAQAPQGVLLICLSAYICLSASRTEQAPHPLNVYLSVPIKIQISKKINRYDNVSARGFRPRQIASLLAPFPAAFPFLWFLFFFVALLGFLRVPPTHL